MNKRSLKNLVSVASSLQAKTKGSRMRSSLVSDNGIDAVFRTSVSGATAHYESTSSVVAKPLAKQRWLATIP